MPGLGIDAMLSPEFKVFLGQSRVVATLVFVPGPGGDFGHGLEGNDAFDGQIGLVTMVIHG